MTKQQPQPQHQEETNPLVGEKIGADLLLRGWNLALETVREAVNHNIRSGVRYPERFTAEFYNYMEPMDIKSKKNWLNACINIKTNEPYTLDALEAAQIISPSERPLFGELPLPRRELTRLVRVQLPDKSEWLSRGERWYGLNRSAAVVTTGVYDLDYTRRIQVRREYVDKNPELKGGDQVIVKIVGESNQWLQAERIYLIPFTKETVQQAMINAGPPTEKSLRGRIELILEREGTPNPHGLPLEYKDNIDAFTNKDFDELFDAKPAGTNITNINIDPEQFKAFLRYQQEHSKDHQYQ